jgi:hypothetical protein
VGAAAGRAGFAGYLLTGMSDAAAYLQSTAGNCLAKVSAPPAPTAAR